jgi:hypothetical protein
MVFERQTNEFPEDAEYGFYLHCPQVFVEKIGVESGVKPALPRVHTKARRFANKLISSCT